MASVTGGLTAEDRDRLLKHTLVSSTGLLFVCLLAGLGKNYSTDSHKIWLKKMITFRW